MTHRKKKDYYERRTKKEEEELAIYFNILKYNLGKKRFQDVKQKVD